MYVPAKRFFTTYLVLLSRDYNPNRGTYPYQTYVKQKKLKYKRQHI